MTVLDRIARTLSDSALVANMERLSASLDEWAANKIDPTGPEFARDRALLGALRQEWRVRSGEVV